MKFELKTDYIQLLTIAVIEAKHDGSELHKEWEDDFNKILGTLRKLNTRCRPDNNYTLTVTVED